MKKMGHRGTQVTFLYIRMYTDNVIVRNKQVDIKCESLVRELFREEQFIHRESAKRIGC